MRLVRPASLILLGIACELGGQEVLPGGGNSSGVRAVGSNAARRESGPEAGEIATGYQGHFACRHFSGVARQLAIAVSDGETETVSRLLRSGADINARASAPQAHGMTLLQTGVLHCWGSEAIRLMIDSGADVNARDRRGDTALTIACRSRMGTDSEAIAQLIKAGAAIDGPGAGGMTPLMFAALCDDSGRVVETLLAASANVKARDARGWTALMHATRRRRENLPVLRALVAAGSPVNARHKSGGTALANAAYNGHTESVALLIRAGADVNSRDSANWSPLFGAAMNGHVAVVQLLLEKGADVGVADSMGRTALQVAQTNKRRVVVDLLKQAGARN